MPRFDEINTLSQYDDQETTADTGEMQQLEQEQESRMDDSLLETDTETMQVMQSILSSQRSFLFFKLKDSGEMDQVKSAIRRQMDILQAPIQFETSGKIKKESLQYVLQSYDTLTGACQNYIDHINAKQGAQKKQGMERLRLVTRLRSMMRNERAAFAYAAENFAGGSGLTPGSHWNDVLYMARARKISSSDVEEVGAGSSVVYKVKNNDGTFSYMKAEESLGGDDFDSFLADYEGMSDGFGQALAAALRKVHRVQPLPKEFWNYLKEDIRGKIDSFKEPHTLLENMVQGLHNLNVNAPDEVRERGRAAGAALADVLASMQAPQGVDGDLIKADLLRFIGKRHVLQDQARKNAKIRGDAVISNRNVSTSRLARDLGTEDIVAKSETAVYEKDGKLTRFNVMQGAKGIDMATVINQADAQKKRIEYTPAALNQIIKMHIMDLIAGQTDRNMGNYFVTTEENPQEGVVRITGISMIDNDLAFGEISGNDLDSQMGDLLIPILTKEGNYSLPFVEEEFWETLKAYTPEQAGLSQADLRSQSEIQALGDRILHVKAQIQAGIDEGRILVIKKKELEEKAASASQHMIEANELAGKSRKGWYNDIGVYRFKGYSYINQKYLPK